MKSEARRFAPPRLFFPFKWSGLRARMTISYVSVTIGSVLSFSLLGVLASGAFSAFFSDNQSSSFIAAVQGQAQSYALVAALQAQGATLDPQTSFIPGQAHTIALPDQGNQIYHIFAPSISTASPAPTSVTIALLIAPDGRLVASSYPSRYPAGMSISALLPEQTRAIGPALAGHASTGTEQFSSVTLVYATEPIWSRDHQPIGAIFLQAPVPGSGRDNIFLTLGSDLLSKLILLVLVTPVGVFFGWITTRALVKRVRRLVLATRQFADGDYSQRVAPVHQDEIGQLEQQFNQMAEQLVENVSRRQQLAAQNARLSERSRISRELHDAISQDLFSLRMLADGLQEATRSGSTPADLRSHIDVLERTTSSMTREMRALLLELRPSQLEHLGLPGALKSLAHAYSVRLGITVTADLAPVKLDVKGEHALLRIAQEALANAARHSRASIISLSLEEQDGLVRLTIVDNGEGFNQETESVQHGLGLHLMQERVEELGGTFDLQTAPGQGTRVIVCLPQEDAGD
ncbi:MAG TPA: ATP-binding protein [Ktedonobacteraceae bacterium]|nr:ATP-binding protein [Ktedonobacteraceae bacterium]